jgi:Tol biopolymer transport system component
MQKCSITNFVATLVFVHLIASAALTIASTPAAAGTIARVSLSPTGVQGNGISANASISADGRYVAYISGSTNLVPNDTNLCDDVFVRDLQTGETVRITKGFDGSQANGLSNYPAISANGRYVAFESWASNLVPDDTNQSYDVFVYDRQTSRTTRVSVSTAGNQGNLESHEPSISATGRYIAFQSWANTLSGQDHNGREDVYVHDLLTGETKLISVSSDGVPGNDGSMNAAISADGRYVGFTSSASNLVPNDTNGAGDYFVHDMQTGRTIRVSVATDGSEGNSHSGTGSLSGDGRYAVFTSSANNLISGDTTTNDPMDGVSDDVFAHDLQTGETTRVSVDPDGLQLDYSSQTGMSGEIYSSISADGRYVAFLSWASNVVPGDTNGTCDVFVRDRQLGVTTMLSAAADGTPGNDRSEPPFISADGRSVVFSSSAEKLVPDDTNMKNDVFVRTIAAAPAPFIIASPPFLAFGVVSLPASSSKPITVMNLGSAAIAVGTLSLGGDAAIEFSIENDACSGRVLQPAAGCPLDIRFTPHSPTSRTAILTVPSDAPNNSEMQVPLAGTGIPAPAAVIAVSPGSVAFGTVVVGASSTQDVVITNNGNADLILGSLSIDGPDAAEFMLLNDHCSGQRLAPASACSFQTQFSLQGAGTKTATLSIPSNALDHALFQVALTGTGSTSTNNDIASSNSGSAGAATANSSGTNDKRCFIATAAYGSYLDPHVAALREFRDRYLLSCSFGRIVVESYYRISPPIAAVIQRHDVLRSLTRWALTPLVFTIQYPLTAAAMALLFVLIVPRMRKNRKAVDRGSRPFRKILTPL